MKRLLFSFLISFGSLTGSVYGQGELWGSTATGGSDGFGVIFKTSGDGTNQTVVVDFKSEYPGASPVYGVTEAPNGKFYGMTQQGGANNLGVVYAYDPNTGVYSKLLDFNGTNGDSPGTFILASNGKLYGTTNRGGGPGNQGLLLEVDPATGAVVTKFVFSGTANGVNPVSLMQASDGALYGTTTSGGSNNAGVIFKYDLVTETYTKQVDFLETNVNPYGRLVQTSNGLLYGITYRGGVNNLGQIFEFNPANATLTKKIDFDGTAKGSMPIELTLSSNGKFYGMTYSGGANGRGVIFEYDPSTGNFSKKLDFTANNGGGGFGHLTQASNGKLYGTVGAYTLFEFDPGTGAYVVKVYPLTASPGHLIQASNGKLYGTTATDGFYGQGTLYEYNYSTNVFTRKFVFNQALNGRRPNGTFVQFNDKLLGMTQEGGVNGYGVLFEIDLATGVYTKKIDFDWTNGAWPEGGSLIQASNGNFYGMTTNGGANGKGVLFEYNASSGILTKKVDFNGTANGSKPYGGLTTKNDGKLVGMTRFGGASDLGVLFEYDPSTSVLIKKLDFTGVGNGSNPIGNLTRSGTGKFYGVTSYGGNHDTGVLFEYDPVNGTLTKKADFQRTSHGALPWGSVVEFSNGKLYGLTEEGATGFGAIYEYDPFTGNLNKKINLLGITTGSYPFASFCQSGNGKLYAMTYFDAAYSKGALLEYDPATNGLVKRLDFNGANGANPRYSNLAYTGAGQTITFNEMLPMTYGDPAFTPNATSTSGLPVSYSSSNLSVATVSNNVITIVGAGTTVITASQQGDIFYRPAQNVSQTLTVNKAALVVTADAKTKVYGDANPPLTFVYSGFKGSDNAGVIDVQPTISTPAGTTTDVGSYPIALAGGSDNNYTMSLVNGTLTITKSALTISADAKTKIYGDANPAFSMSYSGFKGTDDVTAIDTQPTSSCSAGNSSDVGSYPITLAGGTDNNYSITLVNNVLTITRAVLSATADAITKTYGDPNPGLSITYTGFKGADDLSVIDAPPTAASTATTTSNAGTYPINLSGGADNNYSFSLTNNTLTITQAVLTVTAEPKSKIYGDPNPALTISYSGFKGTDNTSILDVLPTASTTATITSNVGTYPITPAGGSDNNYSFSYVNGSLAVTQAVITATADHKSKIYGDANPILTIAYSGFKGTDNSNVIDVLPTASTTATTTSNVATYPITPAGGSDNNYSFSYVNATLTVTQAVLTATAENKTKTYGDPNPTLTVAYSGFKGTDNATVLDGVPTASTSATTASNVGTYPITPTGGSDNNYTFSYVNGTLTIVQAVLTATADNKSKIYGDANPTLTISYSGFKGTDNSSVLDVLPSASTTATTTSNVTTYPITPAGGSDNNYSFFYVNGALTISKAVVTATADNKSKVYGDANPVLSISYSGFKGADNSTVLDVLPNASTTATATSNVGTYPITPAGGSDNNYTYSHVNGTLTITKAVITATADNKSRVYGDTNPTLTISYAGFKGTDNAGVIDVLPTASTTATTTSNVGTYPVTPAGGSDNNYSFSHVNGTLTITKAVITATADNKSKVYGDANPTLTISYSGFKGTDNASVLDVLPAPSTTATTTSNVSTYPITPAGGSDNNYSFSYVNGTLTITKAVITATADNKSKVYGDANPALTISYSGFKGADNSTVLDVLPNASTTATVMSNVSTYPITPAGGSDNNYSYSYVNGALTITKAVITATADNKSRVYGDANPTLTISYAGFKGTDNSGVIDVLPTASTTATNTSDVSTYTITPSGGSDNNYSFSFVNGTLTITKAPLTGTADNKSKIYGDVNPPFTISYSGFKGTDNSSVLDILPMASTTATTTSNVSTYPITPAGGSDNNYSFSYVNGTLTITKAALTATADNKSKVYGDMNPNLTISYSGFKGTDDPGVLDALPATSTNATTASNAGTYPITVTGGSDNNYALTLVDGMLTINKALLTATADPQTRFYFEPNPSLTITYTGFIGLEDVTVLDMQPSASTPATLTSNVGTYPINLSGGSDNNYSFSLVNSTLTIYKAEQSITFPEIEDKTYGDGPFILFAIGGPTGNPVTYTTSDASVISVFGNVATIVGAGTCILTASQAGNQNYNAATPESQSVTVNPAVQTITFNAIPPKNFGDASFDPGATSSSGLPVTYSSSDPAVATINNNAVTIVGVGTATITASQAGTTNVAAAGDQTQTLTVNASPLAVTPASATICLGTSTTLTASGAATYTWSPASGLSATTGSTVTANPRTTTTYTITATYENGLTTTGTATVKVNSIPLAAGTAHSVIMYCGSCGGGVTSSGLNTSGQLGDGTTTQRISPVTLGLTGVTSVAAGANHTLFLKDDGTVWATGLNTNGQLGIGSTTNRTSPIQISTLSGIVAISAGTSHSLFLKNDGTVWAAGLNTNGQLGDASTTQRTTPVQVAGLTSIVKISAGGLHSLFLRNDATVWACGRNTNGQLGDGTTTQKATPFRINSLSGIIEISGGTNHSHFIKSNGNVYATGLNSSGQLGDGTVTQRTIPVALGALAGVIAVSGGGSHTLFLRSDGTVWATGLNTNSQLGDGTTTQANAPILISSLTGVTAIDAGATHSLALTSDGLVWAFGRNANGQLGDGTTTVQPFPVQIVNVNPCGRFEKRDQPKVSLEPEISLIETYPNPADQELTIDLPHGAPTVIVPILIFDAFGHQVIQDQFNPGEATRNLNISKLSSGVYMLRVNTTHGPMNKKVLIVH